MGKIRTLGTVVAIGNKELPVLNWRVSLGSYGSLATAEATTSLALLEAAGIDIMKEEEKSGGVSFDIYVGYDGNFDHIFGGVFDKSEFAMHDDKVSFQARDHGAVLADTKQSIGKIDYKNKKITEIVKQFAEEHDLEADIKENDAKAGHEAWDENTLIPKPQPRWSLIQKMALKLGWEAKISPDKKLYFGPPGGGSSKEVKVHWAPSEDDKADNPLKTLDIIYSPRRNKSFEVRVYSYHPHKAEATKGISSDDSAYLKSIGVNYSSGGGKKKKKSGTALGTSTGRTVKNYGGQSSAKPSKKPVINVHMDGLSAEQCTQKAEAIADDLAKRQVVINCSSQGIPKLQVHSKVKLVQGQKFLFGFDKKEYVVTSVNHSFTASQGGTDGGWTTDFTAASPAEKK